MMNLQRNQDTGKYGTSHERRDGAVPGRGRNEAAQVDNLQNPHNGIATWNVRTMLRPDKLENIKMEMRRMKISVLGISETRYKDEGDFLDEGFRVIHSGSEGGQGGVAIILDPKTGRLVKECLVINARLMMVRISAKPVDMVIIQVYMPTTRSEDEVVDEVYEQLEQTLANVSNSDNAIVLGDFNAVVGMGREGLTVGPFGLGRRNERGQRLVDFCTQEGLMVANTWFETHPRRRYTWKSPGDLSRYQIDYILVKQRYRNQVKKACSYPGADIETDHSLVKMTTVLKFKPLRKKIPKRRLDIQALKQTDKVTKFQEAVQKRLREVCPMPAHVEGLWNSLRDCIKSAAEESIGYIKNETKQPWITKEIMEKIAERRKWKNCSTIEGKAEYRKLRNAVQRLCQQRKEEWYTEKCTEIEEDFKNHRLESAYKRIRKFTAKKGQKRNVGIKDANGNSITDPDQLSDVWKTYIEELYRNTDQIAEQFDTENSNLHEELREEEENMSILRDEFDSAIMTIRGGRAPGIDELGIELWQMCGNEAQTKLFELVQLIYSTRIWPTEFCRSIIVPIPKKCQPTSCKDYRTLSLVVHASKILLEILRRRIQGQIEGFLDDAQFGFRSGRSTRDAIGSVRFLAERLIDLNRPLFICFVDFEKAFDCVEWQKLFELLQNIGCDRSNIALIKTLYLQQVAVVRTNAGITEDARIERGVRQGCLLSPSLFNAFADLILEVALDKSELGIRIGGRLLAVIKYADDLAVLAESAEMLETMLQKINEVATKYGMKINVAKTKTMCIARNTTDVKLSLNLERIEKVETFKYLGQLLTSDARCGKDIRSRIAMGKVAFKDKLSILSQNSLSITLRKRLVRTFVWPITLYGAETWTLNARDQKALEAFEMWCWRRLLKISWIDRITNDEVLRRIGESRCILKIIRSRRMRWIGHALRHQGLLCDIIEGQLEGRRPRGRPRKMFLDILKEDAGTSSYQQLKQYALDRIKWRKIIGEADQSDD